MDLRYPIGTFDFEGGMTSQLINEWIKDIEDLPRLIKNTVSKLSNEQLDTPYRPGGWTIRQVIHHIADSHLNAFVRFKLALTEINPVIKPYAEDRWAELSDYQLPIDVSLTLIEALHIRWVNLLKSLTPSDMEKTFIHPEAGEVTIGKNIGNYAWHGRHHLAHITSLLDRMGW